jgi:hypothetical protein
MTSNKKTGIVMVIFGVIGKLYSLITINSELNVRYTYSAPFTEHEILVILAGIVSIGLLIAGVALISSKKGASSPTEGIKRVATESEIKTPTKDPSFSGTKLEGDLVRRIRKDADLRSSSYDLGRSSGSDTPKSKTLQKTLDETYASEHGFWICPRDETMVPNSENSCPVCGYAHL